MTDARLHDFLAKKINEKIEDHFTEMKDVMRLMREVGNKLHLFPDWYFEEASGFRVGWWWKNELTITLPWNEKILKEKVTELQELGWRVIEGELDTPKKDRDPTDRSIVITMAHRDLEASTFSYYWRTIQLKLRMEAKEPDEMTENQTCYLVEIGKEEVVSTRPIYDLVCPESYAELDNKTTESSE